MKLLLHIQDYLRGRERPIAYAIAFLTIAVGAAVVIANGSRVTSLDEPEFIAIANNLAFAGRFSDANDILTAYRAPGLVFFLTPFVWMGADIVVLRLINIVLVGLTMVTLFHLIQRHAGPFAGLCAVALVPLWPVVIYASTTLYPQTLAAFLLVLTIWQIDSLRDQFGLWRAVAAGIYCGALILTIPVVLLLFPVLVGYIFFVSKRRLAHIVVFCLLSAGLVSGWIARNSLAFGAFVPVATSSGYNLIAGNTPEARYDTSLNVRFPEEVYTEITDTTEIERNAILTRHALVMMVEDPGRIAVLYGQKFLHWFDYSNKLLSDDVVEGGASSLGTDLRELILLVAYALILVPLLLHIACIRRYPFKPIEVLAICLWIGAGLVYAIFFTRVRFRLPFDWLIIASNGIFIAAVLEQIFAKWRTAERNPEGL